MAKHLNLLALLQLCRWKEAFCWWWPTAKANEILHYAGWPTGSCIWFATCKVWLFVDLLVWNDYPVCANVDVNYFVNFHWRFHTWLSEAFLTHSLICQYFKEMLLIEIRHTSYPLLPPAVVLCCFIPLTPQPAKRLTAVFQIKRLPRVCEERSFSFLWNITEGKGKKKGSNLTLDLAVSAATPSFPDVTLTVFDSLKKGSLRKKSQQLHWFLPLTSQPHPHRHHCQWFIQVESCQSSCTLNKLKPTSLRLKHMQIAEDKQTLWQEALCFCQVIL